MENKKHQKMITLSWIDFEKEFIESMEVRKDGFIISDNISYTDYFNKSTKEEVLKIQTEDSIFSYKYGISLSEEDDVLARMYSCKCGRLYGRENLHNICKICDTEVTRAESKSYGWLILDHHKVLHPYFSYLLHRTKYAQKMTLMDALDKNKLEFTWKDLIYDNNSEVIEEFVLKYMKNSKDLILKYKDRLFTSKILVMSKNYRFFKVSETLKIPEIDMHKLNTYYIEISNTVKTLNSNKFGIEEVIIPKLKTIMKTQAVILESIWSEIAANKRSLWRAEVYGRRFPNSARLIIEPIIDENIHSIDGVQIPLDIFRVIFPHDIKKILKKKKIHPNKIHNYLDPDYVLTEEERILMRDVVFPLVEHPYLYINREPSMYMTSILGMKVHSLIDEMVMRIPFFVLPAIAGDFDGDVLAVIAWEKPAERLRIFEALGPQASVIDTKTIKYNSDIGPNNNTAVLLYKGFSCDSILKETIYGGKKSKS